MTNKQLRNFWAKVNILGPEDCWEWQAGLDHKGYGKVRFNGITYLAHRIAYELTYDPIPKGLFCCHKCDNSKCVNPGHLFLGTQQDNMADMYSKGRNPDRYGINNGNSKLTKEQVLEIRRLYALEDHLSQVKLGILFGVSSKAIGLIVNRKHWKHI